MGCFHPKGVEEGRRNKDKVAQLVQERRQQQEATIFAGPQVTLSPSRTTTL